MEKLYWRHSDGDVLLKKGHELYSIKATLPLQNWTERLQDTFVRAQR